MGHQQGPRHWQIMHLSKNYEQVNKHEEIRKKTIHFPQKKKTINKRSRREMGAEKTFVPHRGACCDVNQIDDESLGWMILLAAVNSSPQSAQSGMSALCTDLQ